MCDRLYIKMDDTLQSPPPVENRKHCGNGCYYITLMIYNQRVDWGMETWSYLLRKMRHFVEPEKNKKIKKKSKNYLLIYNTLVVKIIFSPY